MSIAEQQRVKILEQRVLVLETLVAKLVPQEVDHRAIADSGLTQAYQFVDSLVKRKPGRPPKVKDGH